MKKIRIRDKYPDPQHYYFVTVSCSASLLFFILYLIRLRAVSMAVRKVFLMFLAAKKNQSQICSITGFWFSKICPRLRPSFPSILAVFWIRIRISFGQQDPDSDSGGQKWLTKSKKMSRNFRFWSAGCSLLRTEGFPCSLDVLIEA